MYSSQKHMISTDNYNSEILKHAIICSCLPNCKTRKGTHGNGKKDIIFIFFLIWGLRMFQVICGFSSKQIFLIYQEIQKDQLQSHI